jgi:hypothetical protein
LPFADGEYWPAGLGVPKGENFDLGRLPHAAALLQIGEAAQAARAAAMGRRSVKPNRRLGSAPVAEVVWNEALAAIRGIVEAYPQLKQILDGGLVADLEDMRSKGGSAGLAMCSKILAIFDMCIAPVEMALSARVEPWREVYMNDIFGDVFRLDVAIA